MPILFQIFLLFVFLTSLGYSPWLTLLCIGLCVPAFRGLLLALLAVVAVPFRRFFQHAGASPTVEQPQQSSRTMRRDAQKDKRAFYPAAPSGLSLESPVTTRRGPDLALNLSVNMTIEYQDAEGGISQRKITIQRLSGKLHKDKSITLDKINAYCHLAGDYRTFYISRIRSAADTDTGHPISDVKSWIAFSCGRRERVRAVVVPKKRTA